MQWCSILSLVLWCWWLSDNRKGSQPVNLWHLSLHFQIDWTTKTKWTTDWLRFPQKCLLNQSVHSTSCAGTNETTGTERVQAVADISHSALCCHSNETHVLMANPHKSAQLGPTPYQCPNLVDLTSGSVQWCGNAARESHTDISVRQTKLATRQLLGAR